MLRTKKAQHAHHLRQQTLDLKMPDDRPHRDSQSEKRLPAPVPLSDPTAQRDLPTNAARKDHQARPPQQMAFPDAPTWPNATKSSAHDPRGKRPARPAQPYYMPDSTAPTNTARTSRHDPPPRVAEHDRHPRRAEDAKPPRSKNKRTQAHPPTADSARPKQPCAHTASRLPDPPSQHIRRRTAPNVTIPIEPLKAAFDYDPATGIIWRKRHFLTPPHRRPAGGDDGSGYLKIVAPDRRQILAHRLAFALMESRWPTIIDHINGQRSDNRWSNLRDVSASENTANRCTTAEPWPTKSAKTNRAWLPEQPPAHNKPRPPHVPAQTYGRRSTPEPDISAIRERFTYDPATGAVWHRRLNAANQPRQADHLRPSDGYHFCNCYDAATQKARVIATHRIAFALMANRWPHMVDHLDRNRANNQWTNLREVTAAENAANKPSRLGKNQAGTAPAAHIRRTDTGWMLQIGWKPRYRKRHKTLCAAIRDRDRYLHRAKNPETPSLTGRHA
ncbi:MAG: HNH endonuclease [Bacteriophage sp.]|nr:MAG: HNH endonuclease [Bacteriophage sp.]